MRQDGFIQLIFQYVEGYLTLSVYPDTELKDETSAKAHLTAVSYEAIKRRKL